MVNLGDKVRDRINGFEGIVTGRAVYLYGCVQVLVAPTKLAEDGKCPDSVWFDEDRVEAMAAPGAERPASADERAGGPLMGPTPPGR
jgi:hypothetical protein